MEPLTDTIAEPPSLGADEALWASSLEGNGEAFGALFDRHRDRVFAHAYRLTGDRQDAEDLAASAFLELWRQREKLRLVDGSVLPWLLVTVTNLGRNATRARRRYQGLLERLPRTGEHPDTAEVALDVHALGIGAPLRDGLLGLGKLDAQLFVLVALEGYPVGVAAELLGLSVSGARARLHRARGRLRADLADTARPNQAQDQGGTR